MNFDLESLIRPLDGYDKNQPGYEHRKGWNDAIRHVMELQQATAAPASADKREKAKRAFLAGWMRYNTASDADIQRAHTEFDAWWPEVAS